MVVITKEEAGYLRSRGVDRGIVRTMKQKSKRGKRMLCCEDRYIMEILDEYRNSQKVVFEYGS